MSKWLTLRRMSEDGSATMSRRSRHGRLRQDRGVDDQGITLIEIVITVTLLGLIIVPILVAVTTSIKTSQVSQSAAQVETLLVNAVDRVNRATQEDFPCSLTSPVTAAVETVGWPSSSATVYHEYLDTDGNWKTDDGGQTACRVPTGFQNGIVQRVTITITSPEDGISRSLQVVRGDI